MTEATQTVGFIGLGQMGRPMVENLGRAGFPVLAFDLDARALAEAATLPKVSAAGSAAELAKRAATVVLMLPDSRIVDRLMWDDGFAARLAPGTLLIDMGSSNPMNTRENKVEAFMLSGRFDSGFALALMRKDLQTALSLMDDGADHTAFYRYARQGERPAGQQAGHPGLR